jgi:hypothetical protein
MVKLSVPLSLLAVAVASVVAQQDGQQQSSQPQQQSSQPQQQGSQGGGGQQSQSPKPTSAANQGSGSGSEGDDKNSRTSPVCSALFGDPNVHQVGSCSHSSTVVPPYNLGSLVSYMIGGYTRSRKDAGMVVDVADELAASVVKYYPTVTQSSDVIKYSMYRGLLHSIRANDKDFDPSDEMKRPPGAEPDNGAAALVVPGAVGVAAAVLGGAIFL